jgi:hypothetical protein
MINLLTEDMSDAIDQVDLTDKDKEIIKSILYQERQNKERAWDNDAEKYIVQLIDENITEGETA